ncbi:MAG: UDP-N-acetylmuramoyl-L-alanine--D-glutamate ligase [Acidobacteria bacterium]|nr:UDP-N-acetylmuramoyl-L-alanine--D-glutamate ligase [Acidobacteriota bacterium]
MRLADFENKTTVILGLGREGQSTWRYLRAAFPEKIFGLADHLPLEKLGDEVVEMIRRDSRLRLHLGTDYLKSMAEYQVIVKSPGIPILLPEFGQAAQLGKRITSHTAIFFANCPGRIIGVTGTKGKSTTASLIHAILRQSLPKTFLVGNIGAPALDLLPEGDAATAFVYELSSHQLIELQQSPQTAVLHNIVPEHLDYYESFDQYVAAKENITRYQTTDDVLIYDADHKMPCDIASRSRARRFGYSLEKPQQPGCFLEGDWIVWSSEESKREKVLRIQDVPLLGRFNLANVAAAVAAGKLMGVANDKIAEGVQSFQPLEHRLELVGTYDEITYYNDAIATVPEATIAALDTLGETVETILLGGADRQLDFSLLAKRLLESNIRTVILFPPTGKRIWDAICGQEPSAPSRFAHLYVESMEQAVSLAKQQTAKGKICLHSPASPSFGLFRDYRERGEQFKQLVRESP